MFEVFVFRVENEDGDGPYRGIYRDGMKHVFDHPNTTDRQPCPVHDVSLRNYMDEVDSGEFHYGFASIDQYHNWFHEKEVMKKVFLSGGFKMVIYSVNSEDVIFGDKQVLFKRYPWRKVKEIDVSALL